VETLLTTLGPFAAAVVAVLAAMAYRRDDAGKTVTQQGEVFDRLDAYSDRIEQALERKDEEIARLEEELVKCRASRADLERELGQLRRNR
jgi:septal ring factor EnvC (AmiA/AmiB activator)